MIVQRDSYRWNMIEKIKLVIKRDWLLIALCLVITAIVLMMSSIYNQSQILESITETSNQLNMMAQLKSMQIGQWRDELLVDAETFQNDLAFSTDMRILMENKDNLLLIQEHQSRLRTMLYNPNYSSLFVLDSSGQMVFKVGKVNEQPGNEILRKIDSSDKDHEIVITDLYIADDGLVKMDMLVPLYDQVKKEQPPYAYLDFLITPDLVLYPMLQAFVTSDQSLETLIVRKEGENALFLNDLRFQQNSALTLSIPSSKVDVLAIKAITGSTGFVSGTDYRDVPVVGFILPIEGTDWKIIVKTDQQEVLYPIRKNFWVSTLLAVIVANLIILLFSRLWRRKSASIMQGLTESETKRRLLEQKYLTLFNQANDAILLIEESGRITEANESAASLYGYSHDELLSLTVHDLRDDRSKVQVKMDMDRVKEKAGDFFETIHRKQNGEKIFVEVSSKYLSIGGHGFFQSMVRDITDKKKNEEILKRSEKELNKAQQVSHVGSWYQEVASNSITWSEEMFNIFGLSRDAKPQKFDDLIKLTTHPDDLEKVWQISSEAMKNKTRFSFETRIIRPDGAERTIWVETGELYFDEKQEVIAVSGIVQDVTERKVTERELRKRENLLQRIFDLLPVGLWITDNQGKLVRSNKMVKEIWGKDLLVDADHFDVFRGRRLPSRQEIKPDDWASLHTVREGITIRDEMIEIEAYDGKTKTILNYSTPIMGENNELEGAIVLNLDITELKKAEEQLTAQLDELRRWNLATLGRENRVRELKAEINELRIKQGLKPKYKSVTGEEHE